MPAPKRSPTKSTAHAPADPYFSSIAVVVSDRQKALEWYTQVLGLDVIENEGHWVTVGRKGRAGEIHLCQTTEYDANGTLEPGNSGIMFRLPGKDFSASCEALRAKGVVFAHEPTHEEWGWWASIRDPDGNEHSLSPEG